MKGESLIRGNCIRTVSGLYIDVFKPKPETISIEDIAHSLSMQCRFGGHLPIFYSVAEHCIIINCSKLAGNNTLKLQALMHDAGEAYLLDLPRPIKKNFPDYKKAEEGLMKAISEKFGIHYPFPENVKYIDNLLLQTEWRQLMLGGDKLGRCLTQQEAKAKFLETFYDLRPKEQQKVVIRKEIAKILRETEKFIVFLQNLSKSGKA